MMMMMMLLLKMRLKDEDDTAADDGVDAEEWVLLISSVNVTGEKLKSVKCCLLVSCKGAIINIGRRLEDEKSRKASTDH